MSRRRSLAALLAVGVVLLTATSAIASWTTNGPGAAGAAADQLQAPAGVAVSTVDDQSLLISWSAPAGLAPTSYLVHRVGGTVPVCSVAADSPLQCTDSGLEPGTEYVYTVQATLHAWSGPHSQSAAGTTGVASAPPMVTISYPGASTDTHAWSTGCTPAGLCGTAGAADGRTLEMVEVSISGPGGFWWDGEAFGSNDQQWLTADGTAAWSYAMPAPPVGTYTLHVRGTDDQSDSTTAERPFEVTAVDPPPSLVSLEMFDRDADGKVDELVATFDKLLQPSTAAGPWVLTEAPSGASLNSVSVSGTTAILTLNEGGGVADTSVGGFTVALTASPDGIRDAAGNQASFGPTAPTDKAGPVLVSLADQAGAVKNTAGRPEQGDTLDLTFSEAVSLASMSPRTVTLAQETGTADTTLEVPGVVAGDTGARYFAQGGERVASFDGSTLTTSNAGKTIRLTLGQPGTNARLADVSTAGGTARLTPSTEITDPAQNSAAGTTNLAGVRFF